MRYIKGFDTIRALAVFFVIVEHWGPFFDPHSTSAAIKSALVFNGDFGVNLFFVLSGFLITSILLQQKEKNTGGKELTIIKNFFVRRVLRIFPIYYLVIVICYLLHYDFVREHIWYFLTYTSNLLPYYTNQPNVLSHTWTLAVEEQFYLIWPWLIIFINKKYLKYLFAVAIIIGVVSKYMAIYRYHHYFPVLVINCFDSFGIGAAYAYIRQDRERLIRFSHSFKVVFPLLLFFAWKTAPFGGYPVCVMYTKILNSIIAVALIMFAEFNHVKWVKDHILENRTLNFIGKISYGLYLYHYTFGSAFDELVIAFVQKYPSTPTLLTNFYVVYCIKLALLVAISWLSFRLIEEPVLRLKKKFEYTSS